MAPPNDNQTQSGQNDEFNRFRQGMKDTTSGVFGLAGALAFGRPTIETATKGIASVLGAGSKSFADTIGKFGGFLDNEVKLYQTLSKTGVSFDMSMQEARLSAIRAGLDVGQLAKIAREGGPAFAALGRSADEGASAFFTALAGMRQPIVEGGRVTSSFATRLRRLGYDFEDVAEGMQNVTLVSSLAARGQQVNQADLQRQTYDYMVQLDGLAKATGKQRDQIEAELRKQQTKGQFKALIMQLSMQGEEGQRKAAQLRDQLAAAEALGQGDMFMDVITKGFAGRDFRTQAALMPEFYSNLQGLSSGIRDQNVTAAQLTGQYETTFGNLMTELTSERNMNLAVMGDLTRATSAMAGAYTGTSEAVLLAGVKARDAGLAGQDAYDAFMSVARAEQDRQQRDRRPGEGTPGSDTTKALLDLQEKMIDIATATQVEATNRVYNNILTPAVTGFANQLNEFNVTEWAGRLVEAVQTGFNGAAAPQTTAKMNEMLNALTGSSATNEQRQLAEEIQRALNDTTMSDADRQALINRGFEESGVQRRTGSVGMTGSILENFGSGTQAVLHGREAVLTEEQLTRLAQGLYDSGAGQAMQGMRPQMESLAASMRPQMESMASTMAPQMQRMASSMMPQMENMARSMAPQLQGMLNTMRPQMTNMAETVGPQMANMAEQMRPMMEQMASQMQGPMKEMAEQMRGPMEQLAGTARSQLNVSTKAMKANRASIGNIFKGIKL